MIYNGEIVDISYAGSQPLSMTYDGATYYYVLNGQGDVIGLTDSGGNMAIGYTYGAYGTIMALAADENLAPVLVQMNPLTYRGYVYDRETKLYYLQSRYYDPELGRFINADAYASTGQGILGNNMFAYCENHPANFVDFSGYCADSLTLGKSNAKYIGLCPVCGGSSGGGSGVIILIPSLVKYIDKVVSAGVFLSVSYAYRQYTRYIKASTEGILPSNYPITHHIIPYGAFSTRSKEVSDQLERAQEIMKRAKVDPEHDRVNQMVLSASYHSFLHNDKYILMVTSSIIALGERPTQDEIYIVLNEWRSILAGSDPFAFAY